MVSKFNLRPGQKLSKSAVHELLGGSSQQAMTSCLDGQAFLLFYDPETSKDNSYDLWEGDQPDGTFNYVGQGLYGDQEMDRSNKGLVLAAEKKSPIYFFRRPELGVKREVGNPYTYVGLVTLGEPRYEERSAPDLAGNIRRVFVFKLFAEVSIDSETSKFTGPKTVSITPAQGVYALFSAFDYTPWQALGEFIDNSISSWLNARSSSPLQIDITWDPNFGSGESAGKLTIRDNAAGIALSEFARAFELATPPADMTKLNQFGVGMKVAACWFGREWTVETSSAGDPVRRTVNWNVDEIVSNGIQELKIVEAPEPSNSHFTVVTISNMHHAPSHASTIAKIRRHIPKLFRKFLESGDVTINWNGEALTDSRPNVLVSPSYKDVDGLPVKWETDFSIEMNEHWKVQGYACVLERFDRQHTGLNYFWRGRLIQGNVEPFHRPQSLFGAVNSFRTGRLYVEIIADSFQVTSDKTSIDFGKSKIREEDFLDKVKAVLLDKNLPIAHHAENYRSNQPPPNLRPRIDSTLNLVTQHVEGVGTTFLEEPTEQIVELKIVGDADRIIDNISDRLITHNLEGTLLQFRVCCVDSGQNSPWIEIEWSEQPRDEHRVYLNLAHPFIRRHLSAETIQVIIGFGVSMLYGEYKALSLVTRDELRLVRGFTERFMRLMANYVDEIDDATEN
jgi:hypothetical protein